MKSALALMIVLWMVALGGCASDELFLDPEPPVEVEVDPDWSPDGATIAYTHSLDEVWLLDLQTTERRFLTKGMWPVWSPEGKRIAYVKANDVHVIEVETEEITRLTDWGECYFPSWSPDGTRICYDVIAVPADSLGLWIMNSDGSGKTRVVRGRAPDWSPDGATLAYVGGPGSAARTESQIWLVRTDGTEETQLTERAVANRYPCWSPDGARIAWNSFGSRNDSSNGIWIMNADGTNQRKVVRDGSFGGRPSWSPDGERIVYPGHNKDSDTVTLWIVNADGTDARPLTRPEDYGTPGGT
ncbi:PD40 domain-containing protein [Candidatus Fermentibacteria bacterium]|nr:PD40 domain-containing protein [Candidatus Fermentibacteria bacterium]